MSRTYRKIISGFKHYHRHPHGHIQNLVALERAREEGVHVKIHAVPSDWDDLKLVNESDVTYKCMRKLLDAGWSKDDVIYHLVRKWKLHFSQATLMVNRDIEHRDWIKMHISPSYTPIERARKNKEMKTKMSSLADQIIGNILEVGLKQLHQVANRWTKLSKDLKDQEFNYLENLMEKKLKEIGVEYLKNHEPYDIVKTSTIIRTVSYNTKTDIYSVKFIAKQPKED